jgi:hypothetical protein
MGEVILFVLGVLAMLVAIVVAIRVGYWLGYSDGARAGFRDGASFARRKLTERIGQDGYGSYN